jgi:general nucleoside transport system ATP-binding protein
MKVELQNIHKSFGPVLANQGISITFEGGSIYGLLGENGAGKTTLMKILSGFISFDSGEILVNGQAAAFPTPAQALQYGVGMLQQDPLDFPPLRALDNFSLGQRGGWRLNRSRSWNDLKALAESFGFSFDPNVPVGRLTIGERQQLEIIRLLASGVKVLILDEPTTGITLSQRISLFNALRLLARQGEIVILVSHKLEDVQELCSRLTILRQGKVVGEEFPPYRTEQLVEIMFGQIPHFSIPPSAAKGSDQPLLELRNFCVEERRLCLSNMTLTVHAGEVIGLAGVEGSGQRLFLQGCAGIRKPTTGRIYLDGIDMTGQSYQRFRSLGAAYLPAGRLEEGLIAGLNLTEHFLLTEKRSPFVIDWIRAQERTSGRIREFNIVGEPQTRVETLSGGNQQRALLAFLPERLRLLLMEHPTRGLDIESAQWIWALLLKRCQLGTTILFTSSDLDEILERSDRILVFSGGRVTRMLEAAETSAWQLGEMIGGKGL